MFSLRAPGRFGDYAEWSLFALLLCALLILWWLMEFGLSGIAPVRTQARGASILPTIKATPDALAGAGQTSITWSSSGATTCTGTNFSTDGATEGSVSVPVSQNTIYTLNCSRLGSDPSASARADVLVTVNAAPAATLTQRP